MWELGKHRHPLHVASLMLLNKHSAVEEPRPVFEYPLD